MLTPGERGLWYRAQMLRTRALLLTLLAVSAPLACGARTGLEDDEPGPKMLEPGTVGAKPSAGGAGVAGKASAGTGGIGAAGKPTAGAGGAGAGGSGGNPLCVAGETQACGSDVGTCKLGTRTCVGDMFGPCVGPVGPQKEVCNGLDDNCDGVVDDGFHIGEPCKGNGTDQCLDGLTTCDGCKKTGPEKVEICNGFDDNCNGVIDADCEVGDCQPTLLVTGSKPSSPGCIDLPVSAGSVGSIQYPCGGGPVTATLGGVQFTGSVTNNFVTLDGVVIVPPDQTPDGCTWKNAHHIEGFLPSGNLSYSYSESFVAKPPGVQCWQPCTEVGTVDIKWTPG